MKPLSEVAPGILVIQIPIQAVWAGFPRSSRVSQLWMSFSKTMECNTFYFTFEEDFSPHFLSIFLLDKLS